MLPHPEIEKFLVDIGVPRSEALAARSAVPGLATAVLLYGSQARGDAIETSDIDLLALVPEPMGSRTLGIISVSCYTIDQLVAASGTLFGMHLARDGIVLSDELGNLSALIENMDEPDPDVIFERIRHLGAALEAAPLENAASRYGLVRLARYLLRTAIYCEAIRVGEPCFSVRELAQRLGDSSLVHLLSSTPDAIAGAPMDELNRLISRLTSVVGEIARNPHGSLAAMAVNEWDADRDRATVAILALSNQKSGFDYPSLPKVLL